MIKTLNNKPIFKLKNNGWISKPFTMERGIRQGCPVSALLFKFVLEILAIQIRNDNQIKGLSFQRNDTTDDNTNIVQHAYDYTGFIKDTELLTKILKTVSDFTRVAGPRLNIDKTECLLSGTYINDCANESFISWIRITKTCTQYVGMHIGHDENVCYEKKLDKQT